MSNDFVKELEHVINKHCQENNSNTPDYILAEFLSNCLIAWDNAVRQRETWYGRDFLPGTIASIDDNKWVQTCKVIINGREKSVDVPLNKIELSYNDIVNLVATSDEEKEHIFTITYAKAYGDKTEGCLAPGESVEIKDGTIFNCYVTSNA
jgi:hypothetical protein